MKSNKGNNLSKIRSPLTLVLCSKKKNKNSCGLLQLKEITDPELLYRNYFYRSATNDTMREDLRDVVLQSQKLVRLDSGDTIVDIGSNDCTLLNFYSKKLNLFGFELYESPIKYGNFGFLKFLKIPSDAGVVSKVAK